MCLHILFFLAGEILVAYGTSSVTIPVTFDDPVGRSSATSELIIQFLGPMTADHAFDGGVLPWKSTAADAVNRVWYKFDGPIAVARFGFEAGDNANPSPSEFRLVGSNDGSSWTTVMDVDVAATSGTIFNPNTYKEWTTTGPVRFFSYWGFDCDAHNDGGDHCCILKVKMWQTAAMSMKEIKFDEYDTFKASSIYTPGSTNAAKAAVVAGSRYWHSGRDKTGQGEPIHPFPHDLWLKFKTAITPVRVSFRPRPDDSLGCRDFGFCGATKYQILGAEAEPCDETGIWEIICEDLSGTPFPRNTHSKYCEMDVDTAYLCIAISVLGSPHLDYPAVSLTGVRIWKKP